MPWGKETSADAGTGRSARIGSRSRSETWKKPPRRIEASECITCDTCLRNCPPEFGAIFDRGLDVVIVPELCSGCPVCVVVCPVDCIYVDEEWQPTGADLWSHIELTAGSNGPTAGSFELTAGSIELTAGSIELTAGSAA